MHASDLCPEWLDRILHESGIIDPTVSVISIGTEPIGTGQVADSIQTRVCYSGDTAAPASFVAKTSSAKEQSRAAGRSELNYLREVRFYQRSHRGCPSGYPVATMPRSTRTTPNSCFSSRI